MKPSDLKLAVVAAVDQGFDAAMLNNAAVAGIMDEEFQKARDEYVRAAMRLGAMIIGLNWKEILNDGQTLGNPRPGELG